MDKKLETASAANGRAPEDTLCVARELIAKINDGHLVDKQRLVVDRLNTIRVGKSKILKHLQILKEKEESGEYSNRDLVCKLVDSYDELMKQEREYIALMKDIIASYRKAINSVTSELNSLFQNSTKGNAGEKNRTTEEQKKAEDSVAKELDGLLSGFNSMESMVGEVEKASLLDEQFKTCIQLHYEQKRKMELMHQLHMQEKSAQELATKELADCAQNRVSNERSSLDRKQRQLERLRKEAARRGLVKGGETSQQTVSSATKGIGAHRSGKRHSPVEHLVEPEPVIPENERIPSIPQIPVLEPPVDSSSSSEKKKEELRSKITERFASIDARKQRMRLLRAKLNNMEKQKVDNTYDEAVKRVQCLSEMRKKLEDVQLNLEQNGTEESLEQANEQMKNILNGSKDGPNSTTDINLVESQSDEVPNSNSVEPLVDDGSTEVDNRSSASTDELITQVRRAFNKTFKKFGTLDNDGSSPSAHVGNASIQNAISILADRLKTVEHILVDHTEQLTWIGNQVHSLVDLLEHHLQATTPPFQLAKQFSTASAATIVPNTALINDHHPSQPAPAPPSASLSPSFVPSNFFRTLQRSPSNSFNSKQSNNQQLPLPAAVGLLKKSLLNADAETLKQLSEFLYPKNASSGPCSDAQLDVLLQKLFPFNEPSSPSTSTATTAVVTDNAIQPIVNSYCSFGETLQRSDEALGKDEPPNSEEDDDLLEVEQSSSTHKTAQENDDGIGIDDNITGAVSRIMDDVIKFLDDELDKSEPINEEVGTRIVNIVVDGSARSFPEEFDEQSRTNFGTIFGGILSRFHCGVPHGEVREQLLEELAESVQSELLFLRLMKNANAVVEQSNRRAMDDE